MTDCRNLDGAYQPSLHDMYVFRVKKPSETKYSWDYCEIKATIPAEEAFQPLAKSACPL
jgi:branched-chain amino acid transport system substrate-binding protein